MEKTKELTDFYSRDYLDIHRFISYYYQILLTVEQSPHKLLEIGIGNKIVSSYLKNKGFDIVTCDINPDLSPDVVADITNLPFEDQRFDTIIAFEVLEHLPWDETLKALDEIYRISRKKVIISLPYYCSCFEIILKLPFNKLFFKKSYLDFFIRVPMSLFKTKIKTPDHYWEIGRKGFGLSKIRSVFSNKFIIEKEVRPIMNPSHYFLVLKRK
jgi:ubiquinone/menaquinone biosynthesis C-methylase UbiE